MIGAERFVGERPRAGTRYDLSSLPNDAELPNEAARSHRGVEDSLHRVLGVTFREDRRRIEKGATPSVSEQARRGSLVDRCPVREPLRCGCSDRRADCWRSGLPVLRDGDECLACVSQGLPGPAPGSEHHEDTLI